MPHLYDQKQRSRQPVETAVASQSVTVLKQTLTTNSAESPKKSGKVSSQSHMFETSDKPHVVASA